MSLPLRSITRAALIAPAALISVLDASPVSAQAAPPVRVVILTTTGNSRDGLAVLAPHPNPSATLAVVQRGFSGRLLRLYSLEQEFLQHKTGRRPEPAYLVMSDRQGGFPQFGFYLGDQKKADAGWVDLHRGSRLSGQFGAVDQIFPHELMHVIVHQLAGEPRESGSNQMHALTVRTDPVNAFTEGFAETMQVLAVDDADAVDETKLLPGDADVRGRAERGFATFASDLSSRWRPVQSSRLRFLIWFSQGEQVLRYHGVKANRFARAPQVPEALLDRDDKYGAYLFNNVVPGDAGDSPKSATVMLSSEGVVSFLFWRFVSDATLQQRYEPEAFYHEFGTTAAEITPADNVFLKLFAALHDGHPSTSADLLGAYVRLFPEDAADVDRIVREALLGQPLPDAAEIWLANDALETGTSLFDQYRAFPRAHTFDVNAATMLDWLSVPGVTRDQAGALLAAAPYRRLEDVLASPAMSDGLRRQITTMAAAMQRLRERAASEEEKLSLWAIARSYLWRLGAILGVTSILGAWLARRAGTRRVWTAALVAAAAGLIVIAFSWIVISPWWMPIAAPLVLGGLPWSIWRLARRQPAASAAKPLLVWLLASVPALLVVYV